MSYHKDNVDEYIVENDIHVCVQVIDKWVVCSAIVRETCRCSSQRQFAEAVGAVLLVVGLGVPPRTKGSRSDVPFACRSFTY